MSKSKPNSLVALTRFASILVGIAAISAPAVATVISGPIVNPANGHTYYLLAQSTWTDAEAEAIVLGGHLATVNDAAEDAWIFSTFANFDAVARHLWIGLNDVATEGDFVWTSGEAVTYTNFAGGQPDNFNGVEDYVHIAGTTFGGYMAPSDWNDVQDTINAGGASFHGVVEIVPEPGTGALLALGLFGLAAHGRRRR